MNPKPIRTEHEMIAFLLPHFLVPSKPRLQTPLLFKSLTSKTSSFPLKPLLISKTHISHFSYHTLFLHLRSSPNLHDSRRLHALLLLYGHLHQNFSPVLGSQLVNNYVAFNSLQEAILLFNQLPKRNSFAWNSILKGLVDVGLFSDAIEFYHKMVREGIVADNFTYPLVLRACSGLADIEQGRIVQKSIEFDRIHRDMKPNAYTQCALLDMFAKCGNLSEARKVFDEMPTRDLVSWGAIISGTVRSGDWVEALSLFRRMRSEGFGLDLVILATIIPACGKLGDVVLGMGLHCCAVKSRFGNDLCVVNALIDMYSKCGFTQIARLLFQSMEFKDVVSWSSLTAGYSQNCEHSESLDLFNEMIQLGIRPSSVTLVSALSSSSELKVIRQGKEIHGYAIRHGFELDIYVGSALVDLYCKCGLMREAEFIFDILSDKDIAIGNSLITGYAQNGDAESSLKVLKRIRTNGLRPNNVTIVTVLSLCNRFTMLNQGKELHACVLRGGLDSTVSVNNSLIDMYCKCGHLEHGKSVFDQMINRDIITYNTVIAAFGMHGLGDKAIFFFDHMEKERIHPDRVTFIALLSACSHSGLIERGFLFYNSMIEDYGILPDMEHYSCMVDLYGRAGYLDKAWDFIRKMPKEPGIDVLGSLLGACRVHRRVELAEVISNWLFEKQTEDPGYHVLLSNIYADAGRWADVKRVRTAAKERGLVKKPGNSWIHVGHHVHSFLAKDKSHPEFDKIHEIMVILFLDMKDDGYILVMSYLCNLTGQNDGNSVTL